LEVGTLAAVTVRNRTIRWRNASPASAELSWIFPSGPHLFVHQICLHDHRRHQRRVRTDEVVAVWARDRVGAGPTGSELFTTSITLAEILYGIARLPDGRRKELLRTTATGVFATFRGSGTPLRLPCGHALCRCRGGPWPNRTADRRVRCADRLDL